MLVTLKKKGSKAAYFQNAEKFKEASKKAYSENPEKFKKTFKKAYSENPEKFKEASKKPILKIHKNLGRLLKKLMLMMLREKRSL